MSKRIILASGSPRRKQLLGELVDEFEIIVSDVDEEAITCEDPRLTAERLAEAKAQAVFANNPDAVVIGADTVVAYEENGVFTMLAKPVDATDAERMLRDLSARTHFVITGVAVLSSEGRHIFSDRTYVRFRSLIPYEIRSYVMTGESLDKAGGYAIQGGAAGFVESVDGSTSNVVGLPLEMLKEVLRENGLLTIEG